MSEWTERCDRALSSTDFVRGMCLLGIAGQNIFDQCNFKPKQVLPQQQ